MGDGKGPISPAIRIAAVMKATQDDHVIAFNHVEQRIGKALYHGFPDLPVNSRKAGRKTKDRCYGNVY
jgi:hypothetical protein